MSHPTAVLYQQALRTLRDRHKTEFDQIYADLKGTPVKRNLPAARRSRFAEYDDLVNPMDRKRGKR